MQCSRISVSNVNPNYCRCTSELLIKYSYQGFIKTTNSKSNSSQDDPHNSNSVQLQICLKQLVCLEFVENKAMIRIYGNTTNQPTINNNKQEYLSRCHRRTDHIKNGLSGEFHIIVA